MALCTVHQLVLVSVAERMRSVTPFASKAGLCTLHQLGCVFVLLTLHKLVLHVSVGLDYTMTKVRKNDRLLTLLTCTCLLACFAVVVLLSSTARHMGLLACVGWSGVTRAQLSSGGRAASAYLLEDCMLSSEVELCKHRVA